MNAIAIIKAQQPDIDNIIVWDTGDRLVAYAYQAGQVKKTSPVDTPDQAIAMFGVTDGQLTTLDAPPRRVVGGNRWN